MIGQIYWIFHDDGWRICEVFEDKKDLLVRTVSNRMKITREEFEKRYRPKKVKEDFMIKSARKLFDSLD